MDTFPYVYIKIHPSEDGICCFGFVNTDTKSIW